MKQAFFLAFQYLRSSKIRFAVLLVCTSIALSLPVNTLLAFDILSNKLTERGKNTPILIGKKGNEFALTMNALYFRGSVKDTLSMSVYTTVTQTYASQVLPLYISHSASQTPIVGTNIDYFEARDLELEAGRLFVGLGEVVMGASAAADFNIQVGDSIRSDLQNLYNLAGAYPMTLTVVGVLEPSGTSDDSIVLADLRTVWALDGLLHGHEEVTAVNALNTDDAEENLEATAAIFMFSELSDKNRDSYHLHGIIGEMPLSSIAVFPTGQEDHDILLGHFALSESMQAVRPIEVVDNILSIVLKVQQGMYVYFGILLLSTVFFYLLVVHLSLQLRRGELVLIRRIGGSKQTIRNLIGAEIALVSLFSTVLTGVVSLGFAQVLQFVLARL